MRTKRDLLRQIHEGSATVELLYSTTTYRVALPDDADPNSGVWIDLEDRTFVVRDYAEVRACVDGRDLRLTHAEANAIAALVSRTMRQRSRPWSHT